MVRQGRGLTLYAEARAAWHLGRSDVVKAGKGRPSDADCGRHCTPSRSQAWVTWQVQIHAFALTATTTAFSPRCRPSRGAFCCSLPVLAPSGQTGNFRAQTSNRCLLHAHPPLDPPNRSAYLLVFKECIDKTLVGVFLYKPHNKVANCNLR